VNELGDTLLENTRKIQKLLYDNTTHLLIFSDICKCVGDILSANVMVVSLKGKILGLYNHDVSFVPKTISAKNIGEFIDVDFNDELLSVKNTLEKDVSNNCKALIMPISLTGNRMGTTVICRKESDYSVDDIILSEYANTVIDLELMRAIVDENEKKKRIQSSVRSACDTLSLSEREAVRDVANELSGDEGTIVVSNISSKYGITRSIIVNAIKKLRGAGVIDSRSLGMKGTYIKFYNKALVVKNI